jgi:hypothetical protein
VTYLLSSLDRRCNERRRHRRTGDGSITRGDTANSPGGREVSTPEKKRGTTNDKRRRRDKRWTDGGATGLEAVEDKRQHNNQLGQTRGMRARSETRQSWRQQWGKIYQ